MRAWARRWVGEAVRATNQWLTHTAAIVPGTPSAARFGSFGDGTYVGFPQGPVTNASHIHIGADVLVAARVTLSVGMVEGQEMLTDSVIRIGDGCLFAPGTAIVGHYGIDIGDHVYTGTNVYITDQNHAYDDTTVPIGRQAPRDERVRIGAGTWIGAGAVILPGSEIGENVVVAANAVVRGMVPDRCVVAGVPARVVRQHDDENGWAAVNNGGAATPGG
ncbi:MAG: acyltransferase [Actinomycetota bacterium]